MPKQPTANRPRASELLHDALAYAGMGLSIIPVSGKEYVGRTWKKHQSSPMSPEELRKAFARTGVTGLAVILGKVSGDLCCRDYDDETAYLTWANNHPDLAATLPTVKTSRGRHVYFTCPELRTRKLSDGEIRGEGAYVLLPRSQHPDGPIYEWLSPLAGEIPSVDPQEAELSPLVAQVYRETEIRRNRETDDPEETDVVGEGDKLQDAPICSLEQAVNLALPNGIHRNNEFLFKLNRGLLSYQEFLQAKGELRADQRLPLALRNQAFDKWYLLTQAKGLLTPGQSRDDYLMEFSSGWLRVKVPLGKGSLDRIWQSTKDSPPPSIATKTFSDPEKVRLCTLCRELQRNSGTKPFFLSARKVRELFKLGSPRTGWVWLNALQAHEIITAVEIGGPETGKATRFKYLHPLDV